jgi:hypothetical protein
MSLPSRARAYETDFPDLPRLLPGTGRGTMRSMVEGARLSAASAPGPLHPAASRRCPPPRSGEEL